MESVIGIMKKVAAQEVERVYTTELGVVSAVFPHASDGDKDNYQCSVKLKNKKQPDGKDFELRKVPVATQHIGMANIPNMGDLVLISFIGGDLNAPVIIGRLYNDEDRPPVNKAGQVILTQMDSILITTKKGTKIEIDADGNVNIESANGDVVINKGSKGGARKDDPVEVTIPAGTFLTAAPAGVPNAAPIKVTGKITEASGTVKIGD